MRSTVAALVTIALLVGCGSAKPSKPSGTYTDARALCSAFPAQKVARDLGIHTTQRAAIATEFAKGYSDRDAARNGCLAGLR